SPYTTLFRSEGRSACARGGSRVTMHQVTIDGVAYAPVGATESPRIGVAVTTRNRHDVVAKTLESIRKHTPGVRVVVVDDASEPAGAGATYRFTEHGGIARAQDRARE